MELESETKKKELEEIANLNDGWEKELLVDRSANIIECSIGGHSENFLVDSGSPFDVLTEKTFNTLEKLCSRALTINPVTLTSTPTSFTNNVLDLVCEVDAWLTVNQTKERKFVKFLVVRNGFRNILGSPTAKALNVLQVGFDMNTMEIDENVEEFPKMPNVKVKFETKEGNKPMKNTRNRIPLQFKPVVNDMIRLMLKRKIIERSPGNPDWISPMRIVMKPNGKPRLVIDYRGPNSCIVRRIHPMAMIEELWEEMAHSKFYAKLDIQDAFYHVEVHEESRHLLTFMTEFGFTRLAFGVCAAPELFQQEMDRLFKDVKGVVVFMDDIGIHARTLTELRAKVMEIKKICKENNLTLNENKCEYDRTEISFLGHKIKNGKIMPLEDKREAILNFQHPNSMKDLRSFLGMTTYLQSFIQNHSLKTEALRKLLRKENGPPVWSVEQDEAFEMLKEDIANNIHERSLFQEELKTVLYVDAAPVALGAVLIQVDKKETLEKSHGEKEDKRPEKVRNIIACASRSLSDVERRYAQTHLEALSMVWGITHFKFYLLGRHFEVRTDHAPLQYIFKTPAKLTKRELTRADHYALTLEEYNFTVVAIPGTSNIADPFSRLLDHTKKSAPLNEEMMPHALCEIDICESNLTNDEEMIPWVTIQRETEVDKVLQELGRALKNGKWLKEVKSYEPQAENIQIFRETFWHGENIILPEKLQQQVLKKAHKAHASTGAMLYALQNTFWWPSMIRDIHHYNSNCSTCSRFGAHSDNTRINTINGQEEIVMVDKENGIYHVSLGLEEIVKATEEDVNLKKIMTNPKGPWDKEVASSEWRGNENMFVTSNNALLRNDCFVVPPKLREKALQIAHLMHPGQTKMLMLLRSSLWWPNMAKAVENHVKSCSSCVRVGRPMPPEPMARTSLPSEPWEYVAIAFYSSHDLQCKVLVITCYFSRYLVARPASSEKTEDIIKVLNNVFSEFGAPKKIRSDNAKAFHTQEFTNWCKARDIENVYSTLRSAQENGQVERAMQGITKTLRIAIIEKKNKNKELADYVSAYNSWPHTVTQIPPSDLMFGRKLRGLFPRLQSEEEIGIDFEGMRERNDAYNHQKKLREDQARRAKMNSVKIGEKVFIKNDTKSKLDARFSQKLYTIIDKIGGSLLLESESGEILKRSVQFVAKLEEKATNQRKEVLEENVLGERDDDSLIVTKTETNEPEKEIISNGSSILRTSCWRN